MAFGKTEHTSAVLFALISLVFTTDIATNAFKHHRQQNVLPKTTGSSYVKLNIMDNPINKVHIIFMNHLDVGYDGVFPKIGFINVILNLYFTDYFPRAIWLNKQLKDGGYTETFRYTTHPWLVNLYLDCPPDLVSAGIKLKCPNATEISAFENAVRDGVITWHAGPMNMQSEFVAEWLFHYGINMSKSLDEQFGIKRPFKVLSQRDVPGLTKAVIPTLVKAGIGGVSVGVNPMTAPPAVQTSTVFRWKHGNDEVLATWHKGGYPNNPGPNPANPGGLSLNDCAMVTGYPEALCFAFRTDNSGPPETVQELLGYYEILRKEFPGADLMASNLETFMAGVVPLREKLPVVTNEIGDTWIMGVASDPRKTAEYRAISRVMGACIESGLCKMSDKRVYNASRFVLKMGEHTWGLPSVYDTVNWTNTAFYKASSGWHYKNCTAAWIEQRTFLNLALAALGNHSVIADILKELSITKASEPDLTGYVGVHGSVRCGTNSSFLDLSPDGSITNLKYKGVDWSGAFNALGQFRYVSYNETDFKKFGSQYDFNNVSAGFNKVNITANAHPVSRSWPVHMSSTYIKSWSDCDIWAHIQMVDKVPMMHYGAPLDVWVRYVKRPDASPGVDIDLRWFEKTSTRLPESLMFSFEPKLQHGYKFYLSKMGQMIDPLNVILNGSSYLHALDNNGVYYINEKTGEGLKISSPDVALVSLITADHEPSSYSTPLTPITAQLRGFAFNIYNNVWDTNYIFWYPYLKHDTNHRSRFSLRFIPPQSKAAKVVLQKLAARRG